MSKYRVDQFLDLQNAVEQMQKAWSEQPTSRPAVKQKETFEQSRPQTLSDPNTVQQKFSRAMDKNLQVGAMHPHFAKAVGRSGDGQNKVVPPTVKSEARADEWLFPQAQNAQRKRLARNKKVRRRPDRDERDVDDEALEREEIFEDGVDFVEHQARPAHEHPLTRSEEHGRRSADRSDQDDSRVRSRRTPVPDNLEFEDTITGAGRPTEKRRAPLPQETTRTRAGGETTKTKVDRPVLRMTGDITRTVSETDRTVSQSRNENTKTKVQPKAREVTRTDYEYVAGETAYDEWLRKHSQGAKVVKGEGANFEDRDKTKTNVAGKKKPG